MKEHESVRKNLHSTALAAPKSSGVYLWKDNVGQILYVGKAKSLRNRLLSYFSSDRDVKTGILVCRARSIEYITTENEYEALLLENTLIKQHSPRYNINLKDGKTYPVIKITHEPYPRIFRTRRILDDGGRYFGPFPDVNAVDDFLELIKRLYHFRQCKMIRSQKKPCLYYHIGRCYAPCCGLADPALYHSELEEVARLLDSTDKTSIQNLEKGMKDAADKLEFERAALLRDGIQAVRRLRGQNTVVDHDETARDYIAWASEGTMVTFAVLNMRGGRLIGRDLYRVRSLREENELLPEFVMAYYTDAGKVPPCIYVPVNAGLDLLQKWFVSELAITTQLQAVSDMEKDRRHKAAISMAAFNAHEDAARRLKEQGDFPALQELKTILDLPTLPSRIEGFDVSHIGGRLPVASLISFFDGNPDRKNYRLFRLRTTDGIIDDYAAMREITARRYGGLKSENGSLPDLLLVDGGQGQVNAVRSVLDALELRIPIAGLAKEDEQIYRPGDPHPLSLPRRSDALRLLQRIRDETHRFATAYNQKLRTKENNTLAFESLPGIGPAKAIRLLKTFGSLEALATATPEELQRSTGLSGERLDVLIQAIYPLLEARKTERSRRAGTSRTSYATLPTTTDISSLAKKASTHDLAAEAGTEYRMDGVATEN